MPLRILFGEAGPSVPLSAGERVSSQLVEVETFRAVDRERLLGDLDDSETATKRRELGEILARLDVASVDDHVIRLARNPFAVNVRGIDAIHVATAEILGGEEGETVEFCDSRRAEATAALSRGLVVRGV